MAQASVITCHHLCSGYPGAASPLTYSAALLSLVQAGPIRLRPDSRSVNFALCRQQPSIGKLGIVRVSEHQ